MTLYGTYNFLIRGISKCLFLFLLIYIFKRLLPKLLDQTSYGIINYTDSSKKFRQIYL